MTPRAFGVIMVAALMAAVPLMAPANAEAPPRPITWLAAGDSYSSVPRDTGRAGGM